MIIILQPDATPGQREELTADLKARGFGVHLSEGVERTIVGVIGTPDRDKGDLVEHFESLPYVERVVPILKPYKLVGKAFKPEGTVIKVRDVQIGGGALCIMAGPCTVESPEMLFETARFVKAAGAHVLRGGAFKPSTSPYSFHGMGEAGLKLLAEARDLTGLPIITEVMDTRDVELVGKYTDIFQIGTRNMTNFSLLREIGTVRKPVMLKRGWASTIEEWLQAAEYIASQGNYEIILCERGIRTFETYTRNTFDINAIPAIKELSHLPIFADPSHATGKRSLVNAVSRGAVATGADGLIIETHPNPEKAIKDGPQSLTFMQFTQMMQELAPIAQAVGKTL
ncbi:MAG TPA: 3-deoxy-7-phosphoheptulonate synthase [Chthonomonadaceae bacterium]|nr:3-deoxy-7-phosphoheptulonate synthase [Chthonomonadaceae bacterium]